MQSTSSCQPSHLRAVLRTRILSSLSLGLSSPTADSNRLEAGYRSLRKNRARHLQAGSQPQLLTLTGAHPNQKNMHRETKGCANWKENSTTSETTFCNHRFARKPISDRGALLVHVLQYCRVRTILRRNTTPQIASDLTLHAKTRREEGGKWRREGERVRARQRLRERKEKFCPRAFQSSLHRSSLTGLRKRTGAKNGAYRCKNTDTPPQTRT